MAGRVFAVKGRGAVEEGPRPGSNPIPRPPWRRTAKRPRSTRKTTQSASRLARVLLKLNQDDECRKIIAELESRGYLEPEAEKVKSQLELRAAAAEAGPLDEARKTAAAAPNDLSLQLKLADALAVANRHEEALQICLAIVQKDKSPAGRRSQEHHAPHLRRAGPRLGPREHLPPQAGDGAVLAVLRRVPQPLCSFVAFVAPLFLTTKDTRDTKKLKRAGID